MNAKYRSLWVLGGALLFWGWRSGGVGWVVPVAGWLFVQPFSPWRILWSDVLYQRILGVCGVIAVLLGGWAWFVQQDELFVMALLRLSPLIWMPMVLVMAADSRTLWAPDRFLSDRNRAATGDEVVPERPMALWFDFFSLATLLAAGVVLENRSWFFPVLVGFMAVLLWSWCPRHGRRGFGWFLFAVAACSGYLVQGGLSLLQRSLMETLSDELAEWFYPHSVDVTHRRTDIGEVGRLKMSGRILFRVHYEGPLVLPLLLRESSYNIYYDGGWSQAPAPFVTIPPDAPVGAWMLGTPGTGGADSGGRRVTIHHSVTRDQGILALPFQAYRIEGLEVAMLEKNRFGSVRYRNGPPPTPWTMIHSPGNLDPLQEGTAEKLDLQIPEVERKGIDLTFQEAGLQGITSSEEIIRKWNEFVRRRFTYSLDLTDPAGFDSPLSHFLLASRRGHCEYFATASVLLLRRAGIPARYVFGYAVSEPDRQSQWYRVRERDAHAWTVVFVNGAWRSVDFTPPDWRRAEAMEAPLWQGVVDGWSTLSFLFSQWSQGASREVRLGWVVVGFLGLMIYVYLRLFRQKGKGHDHSQVMRRDKQVVGMVGSGDADSPFVAIVKHLEQNAAPRIPSVPLSQWILEQQHPDLMPLLQWHYRWRFDPQGLDAGEILYFTQAVDAWLTKQ
ncbi:MAG: transglutaminase domain-containing protein [Magnetococcales bacterium]|nr:transglutaminase domain-containing protein [Magnetococcales bacterium]